MPSVRVVPLAYNTVYLWENNGARVLVDTGPDYRGAWEALQAALEGVVPDLVVATHGHIDHAGLGARWQALGVPVAIGAADERLAREHQFAHQAEFEAFRAFILSCEAPADVTAEALEGLATARDRSPSLAAPGYRPAGRGARYPTALRMEHFVPDRLLGGDVELPGGLRALACPGHTPGNLVLWDATERWLFSGDQLLPDITPVPGIQWGPAVGSQQSAVGTRNSELGTSTRFRSLPAFVSSLERLRTLGATRCFPGHGEPFGDVDGMIDANLAQVSQRTARVRELLAGEPSLFTLCERLYPRAARRRFWQIVAIVQGHLDLIEREGERGTP